MKKLGNFIYAILAGAFIASGGVVNLLMDNKVVGAFLFSAGLFAVCTLGYNLFTGKVGYFFDNNPKTYTPFLILVYVGNFIGAYLIAMIMKGTRLAPAILEKAITISEVKLNDTYLSLFLLGFMCNLFVVFAVEQYKNNPHSLGKYLGIVYGVMMFILCGYEHSIADMFYFSMAGVWSSHAIICMLVITLGNIFGGIVVPGLKKFKEYTEKE